MTSLSKEEFINKTTDAIKKILTDTEETLDECLVERFLESVEIILSDANHVFRSETDKILSLLSVQMEHENFVVSNKSRVLQTFDTITRKRASDPEFVHQIQDHLRHIWNLIPALICEKDELSICYILNIFQPLATREVFMSFIDQLRIENPSGDVVDFQSFIKYILENLTNYHSKNKIGKFMKHIIHSIVNRKELFEFQISMIDIIKTQMKNNNILIYISLNQVAQTLTDPDKKKMNELFDMEMIYRATCSKLISSKQNLVPVCKSFAAINTSSVIPEDLICKFRQAHRFEEVVALLGYRIDKDASSIKNYILGPVLMHIISLEHKSFINTELLKKLELDDTNRDYLVEHLTDERLLSKMLKSCLVHLPECIESFHKHNLDLDPHICEQLSNTSIEVLTLFILKSFPSNQNNLLHLALAALDRILQLKPKSNTQSLALIEHIIGLVIQIKGDTHNLLRPTAFYLLNIIGTIYKQMMNHESKKSITMKIVEVAKQFDDQDLLNEICILFIDNQLDLSILDRDQIREFVRLVWNHILPKARKTTHRELIGSVTGLLIFIDLEVELCILEECCKIHRHQEIPRLIGDILRDYAPVDATIGRILSCLSNISLSQQDNPNDVTYIEYLQSPNLGPRVRHNLANLIQGITSAMRCETNYDNLDLGIRLLCLFIGNVIINHDDPSIIIRLLIQTGILELLYDCHKTSDFGSCCFLEKARSVIRPIQISSINLLENRTTDLTRLFTEFSKKSREEIANMIEFYVQPQQSLSIDSDCKPKLDTLEQAIEKFNMAINDIFHEHSDDHNHQDCQHLDCY